MNLLHWVENLYQKLEKACTESEVVQVPCRYVDAVSDRIKLVLDELNDYVNPYDGLSNETDCSYVSVGCTKPVVESDLSSMEDEGLSHHQNICETNTSDDVGLSQNTHETNSSDLFEDCMESTLESNVSSSQNIHERDSLESMVELNVSNVSSMEDEGSSKNIHEPDSLESSVESNLSSMKDERSTQNIHEPESLESVVESNVSYSEDEGSTQNIHKPDSLELMVESNVYSSYSEDRKFPDRTEEDSNIPQSVNSSKTIGSNISDENEENIKNVEHIISSKGELSLATSLGPEQELSRKIRCDEHGSADVIHFPESSYNITPSEFHENELIDERSIGLDTTSLPETHGNCMSQETISLLRSLTYEHDQQYDLNKVDDPEQLSKAETGTKISDDNYMKDVITTTGTVIPTRVLMDSFEDINLNTCWEDAEDAKNFELIMTPNHVSKESPKKMKLKNIFISKVLAAKRKKKVKNQSYVTDIKINAQSSNSIEDSCDSDWVLL